MFFNYLEKLRMSGRVHFTYQEIIDELSISEVVCITANLGNFDDATTFIGRYFKNIIGIFITKINGIYI